MVDDACCSASPTSSTRQSAIAGHHVDDDAHQPSTPTSRQSAIGHRPSQPTMSTTTPTSHQHNPLTNSINNENRWTFADGRPPKTTSPPASQRPHLGHRPRHRGFGSDNRTRRRRLRKGPIQSMSSNTWILRQPFVPSAPPFGGDAGIIPCATGDTLAHRGAPRHAQLERRP